MKREVLDCTH